MAATEVGGPSQADLNKMTAENRAWDLAVQRNAKAQAKDDQLTQMILAQTHAQTEGIKTVSNAHVRAASAS